MPEFDEVLVTGNQTIEQDLQVDGNETVGEDLNVDGNETVGGSLQVDDSESVAHNLGVGGTIDASGSVQAAFRVVVTEQPSLPAGEPTVSQVNAYSGGVVNQPGILLQGTDGKPYVLFVDLSTGTPSLGIQPA